MKIKPSVILLAQTLTVLTLTAQAQTTPAGTVNSTTYPQGAVAPDSLSTKAQKRAMKQTRRNMNQTTNGGGTTNKSAGDARYRQSTSSDGTAVGNSNITNNNSNNVTNAPTGVGSNPNTERDMKAADNTVDRPDVTGKKNADAGAVQAIEGARSSEMPAVKAGSTTRNTSVGDFIASSPNFTTLQNTLQTSGLYETLKGTGPFTLFAPDNEAFKKLASPVQKGLLDGDHQDALKNLLMYHVVSGDLTMENMSQQIKSGGGKAMLKTLAGTMLTAQLSGDKITLTDEQGNKVSVQGTGNRQANGMVYPVGSVLMPNALNAAFK